MKLVQHQKFEGGVGPGLLYDLGNDEMAAMKSGRYQAEQPLAAAGHCLYMGASGSFTPEIEVYLDATPEWAVQEAHDKADGLLLHAPTGKLVIEAAHAAAMRMQGKGKPEGDSAPINFSVPPGDYSVSVYAIPDYEERVELFEDSLPSIKGDENFMWMHVILIGWTLFSLLLVRTWFTVGLSVVGWIALRVAYRQSGIPHQKKSRQQAIRDQVAQRPTLVLVLHNKPGKKGGGVTFL